MDQPKITEDEIKETLMRSGYFLESRILDVLQKKNYTNTPNSTYPDKITGKSRELDIYSESDRTTENIQINHFLHFEIQHKLIIECINNLQPVVFFKRPDTSPFTIFCKFLHSKVLRNLKNHKDGFLPESQFDDYTTTSKKFHYNKLKPNSQYCSFTPKKAKPLEWMASHSDGLHDTFNKLFDHAHYINERYNEWMPKSSWFDEVFVVLQYPILILQNELFEASDINGEIVLEKKDHLIFEFNRYHETPKTILIDIVTETYFDKFLDSLDQDMKGIKEMFVEYYKEREITESARKIRSRRVDTKF